MQRKSCGVLQLRQGRGATLGSWLLVPSKSISGNRRITQHYIIVLTTITASFSITRMLSQCMLAQGPSLNPGTNPSLSDPSTTSSSAGTPSTPNPPSTSGSAGTHSSITDLHSTQCGSAGTHPFITDPPSTSGSAGTHPSITDPPIVHPTVQAWNSKRVPASIPPR